MNNIATKISYLKKVFEKHNYDLNEQDINDLKRRLISKPIQLYLLSIHFLEQHKAKVNYTNVRKLIIIDIRIRDNIKKIITPLEEAILVQYTDAQIKQNDWRDFQKLSNEYLTLNNIIKKLQKKNLHLIREIRNSVSHIVYPILFNKFKQIIKQVHKLKSIDFVESEIITKLLAKIWQVNNGLNLECVDELFEKTKARLSL